MWTYLLLVSIPWILHPLEDTTTDEPPTIAPLSLQTLPFSDTMQWIETMSKCEEAVAVATAVANVQSQMVWD